LELGDLAAEVLGPGNLLFQLTPKVLRLGNLFFKLTPNLCLRLLPLGDLTNEIVRPSGFDPDSEPPKPLAR
jgi:hypothetical protein